MDGTTFTRETVTPQSASPQSVSLQSASPQSASPERATPAPRAAKAKKPASVPTRYRLAVASRFIVATFGGYLLASLFSVCITQWMPLPRAEAVLAGMMLSFLAYLGAFIWCFSCRTAWHAWAGVMLPCALLGAAYACGRWLL